MSDEVLQSIELFFQEQPSDKVYNVRLLETDKGYTVAVEWGRRGAKLSTGTKAVDAPLDKAKKAYDKVVKQKQRKGYEVLTSDNKPQEVAPEQGHGSASKAGGVRRAVVGIPAQLLNNADEAALERYFEDPELVAQQKLDGMRVVVHVNADGVLATNRAGQETSLAPAIDQAVRAAPVGTILDGELLADPLGYWVFDLLAWAGEDTRELAYRDRYARLVEHEAQFTGSSSGAVALVPWATSAGDKRALHAKLVEQQAEGIVFKRADANYTSGRPASGGPQLKLKFVKTADVFITENAGNAYQMAVFGDDGAAREIGKVFAGTTSESRARLDAILSDGERPVAEVRYLYASDDDNLVQPVFVRLRTDKPAGDCLLSQLLRTDRAGLRAIDDGSK